MGCNYSSRELGRLIVDLLAVQLHSKRVFVSVHDAYKHSSLHPLGESTAMSLFAALFCVQLFTTQALFGFSTPLLLLHQAPRTPAARLQHFTRSTL